MADRRVILAAVALAASPAPAASYAVKSVGAWTVSPSRDGQGCFVSREYDRPGRTTLLLGVDRDGSNHLSVLNANWSIASQDKLDLDFRLTRGGYLKHAAVGMVADSKQGFVTSFEPRFPTYFAASRELLITRGRTPVERLDLGGSGDAVAELRRCVGKMRPGGSSAKPVRSDGIPLDPFANRKTGK